MVITDDIDGSPGAETVSFGLDGVTYETGLAPPNKARLTEAVAPYMAVGRRISQSCCHGPAMPSPPITTPLSASGTPPAIRASPGLVAKEATAAASALIASKKSSTGIRIAAAA
jgi:hypothetical protein